MPRIVVDGADGVGKYATWVRVRHHTFVEGTFDPVIDNSRSLITVDGEEENYDLLWTNAQDTESGVDDLGRRGYDAIIILMYSVDLPESFDKLPVLLAHIKALRNDDFPVVVVANKIDLPEHKVSIQSGEEFARSHGFPFLAISLRTGEGVDKLIPTAIRENRRRRPIQPPIHKKRGCIIS